MSYFNDHPGSRDWVRPVIGLGITLTVFTAIYWFAFGYYADVTSRQWKWFTEVFVERGFAPDGVFDVTQWTKWGYLFFGFALVIVAIVIHNLDLENSKVATIVAAVAAGAVLVYSVVVWVQSINEHSAAYASGTTFVVSSTDEIPDSLQLLAEEATGSSEDCVMLANRDMPGCIAEGQMDFTWEARTASFVGAEQRIKRASTGNNRTQLLDDTLTYTYGDEGKGAWTAIRDGRSKEPIYGVISYDGTNDPTICKFEGEYELNKAFGGRWGTNLSDEIASKYRELHYDSEDRWGYCDGDQPIIVIPVKSQEPFKHRTAFRSAGVLTITGSPTGEAVYQHITNVEAGDFPGPVYPASLAAEQRESMGMIAGIANSWFRDFGHEPVSESSQEGNTSEYLLRDAESGRTYWVTPMKQRSGDNQQIVAYSVIPADVASNGAPNHLQIFVLNDDDPRVASISDMETSVRQHLSERYPGFYTADGYLAEFLPLDDRTWQVYAEINGRVVYRVVVPVDVNIAPTIYEIEPMTEPGEPGEPDNTPLSDCVEDLQSLDNSQLVACLSDLTSELESRQGTVPEE